MHHELSRRNAMPRADVLQQPRGQLRTFAVVHLPAHDLAAEQVHEQTDDQRCGQKLMYYLVKKGSI